MRIAIIDFVNQDIGLKILFPESDYYIHNEEECTKIQRTESYKYYNITHNMDWANINDINYDYLFAIVPVYDAIPGKTFYKPNIHNIYNKINEIIDNNNFKKIFIFDNYDYDYDPCEYYKSEIYDKITLFFKRNYSKSKIYDKKVVPFPFIMFGETAIIEKCDKEFVSYQDYFKNKINRVFFTGTIFIHEDPQYNIVRNRRSIYNKIQHTVYNPGHLNYNTFLYEMRNSKFGLDLLGVGEPNKRTFEILLSGALLIYQKNDMKWGFDEEFNEECCFTDEHDYINKLNALTNDENLYNKCLTNQYNIVKKYFNKEWLRNYIVEFIEN